MPRHVVVSPEEDLASFYGGADPISTTGAQTAGFDPPLPVAPAMAAPSAPLPSAPPAPSPAPRAAPQPAPVRTPPPPAQPAPLAAPPVATPVTTGTDPLVAGLLSLVLPGLGQLVAGQTTKGVVMLILGFLTCGLGGLLNLALALDAYLIAQRVRRGETIQEWQFF